MSDRQWSGLSYLDALRPEPGWNIEFALLASYSVDLVAFVAALLALAGLDDDRGSGSKVDFANATERLKNRVRLVVQSGRIASPVKAPKILNILDSYIRQVPMDESEASWHPKAALLKLGAAGGKSVQWRLWIGSRNLTRDLSWDTGLVLVGSDREGRPIPGIPEFAEHLARRAQLPAVSAPRVRAELNDIKWTMPAGIAIEELTLLLDRDRSIPIPPEKVHDLILVSPFLDGGEVARFGTWGDLDTRRVLVSTRSEISKLAAQAGTPLHCFNELLVLDAPLSDDDEVLADQSDEKSSDDNIPEQRGLHAKLVYVEHRGGRTLWLGSANATQRGWCGPNVEIMCRMSIDKSVSEGLRDFVEEVATMVDLQTLPAYELDEIEERLNKARNQVAARWNSVLRIDDSGPILATENPPFPDDADINLAVGLLSSTLVSWPRHEHRLLIPEVSIGELTQFVRCRLSLGDAACEWLQHTPIDPPLGEERDRRALARYLDPRTFLRWLRSLLTDDPLLGKDDHWDGNGHGSNHRRVNATPEWWVPTIEDALKAWNRDPRRLADVDRKVRQYLKLIEEEHKKNLSDEDQRAIEDFRSTWNVLRSELIMERQ